MGRKWTEAVPTKEGWYFWRIKREFDQWRYTAIFVMDDDPVEGGKSYWESGTEVNIPKGGVWSTKILL